MEMDGSTTTSTDPPHRKTTTFTIAADNERASDEGDQQSQEPHHNQGHLRQQHSYGDYDSEGNTHENGQSSDLIFKKKDLSRSRTQSFQSVLSTASLKSLKQQVTGNTTTLANNPSSNNRNSSLIPSNNTNNTKNFQSFIQAPVLSSVSNLKNDDFIEIGQQLPFNDNKSAASHSGSDKSDQDTIIQQQKLTLNALKKLSLSPMLISNNDQNLPQRLARKPSQKKVEAGSNNNNKLKAPEPYKPAEVDLSSFASLTRQPKLAQVADNKELQKSQPVANDSKKTLPKLEEDHQAENVNKTQNDHQADLRSQQSGNTQKHQQDQELRQHQQQNSQLSQHVQPQHQSIPQSQNQQQQSKVPAAVIPPQSMNTRRQSNNIPAHGSNQLSYVLNFQLHNQPPPSTNQHAINQYKLAQIAQHQQQFPQQPPQTYSQQHQSPSQHQQYPQTPGQQSAQTSKVSKQLQQIKGLRSPMYVPAVLRMTVNGLSPTSSNISSSITSNASSPGEGEVNSPKQNLEHNLNNLQHQNDLEPKSSTASIRSFDSGISVESGTSNKLNGKTSFLGSSKNYYDDVLRAPPTRKHWVKDEVVFKCSIPKCPKVFNFFERRHHCRKCGGIYCKEHTSHYLYINHLAQFTTGGRGTLSKVCDNCISEYNQFIQNEFGVSISNSSQRSTPNLSFRSRRKSAMNSLLVVFLLTGAGAPSSTLVTKYRIGSHIGRKDRVLTDNINEKDGAENIYNE
ncbi:FYVE-domain-containing protein [Suhomyces tanzawaensis NRRL Y-17324]|uniref:FYVE-domain-containing protein n=1 Tax=Suhomyces tanzawaensis NRRL Y-17324 TaxID=984487 RepID=A0A1E4SCP2_9ASCO|nr:FYVE-domain-containing protein [Suhomyces tanzawaensis NRRL Y-17324]ODV77284.1 FYVE-domain-containing protein [Suhomyces tanzawaensis NRRL Y-17324]